MDEQSPTNVLDKADALMRRHRVFVAVSAEPTPAAVVAAEVPPTAAAEEPDDVPVLTEVVAADLALSAAERLKQAQLEALRGELTKWLDEELPVAVLKVTDGLADQLMMELNRQAESHLLPRLLAQLDKN